MPNVVNGNAVVKMCELLRWAGNCGFALRYSDVAMLYAVTQSLGWNVLDDLSHASSTPDLVDELNVKMHDLLG